MLRQSRQDSFPDMAGNDISPVCNNGFSARLMKGKGPNTIPGSLGHKSPRKLHGIGQTVEEHMEEEETMLVYANSKQSQKTSSPPPSKTFHCKDTSSLWKSVQDCHASLNVANPRHFEFAVANLCFLLKASGKELDKHVKSEIDRIFQTIRTLALDPNKRPTTRMQLLKVIELRARRWDVEQRTENKQTTSINSPGTGNSKSVVSTAEIKSTLEKNPTVSIVECTQSKLACNVDIGVTLHSTGRKTGAKPVHQPADSHNTAPNPLQKCEGFKQDSPSSTGFWDAVTLSPAISSPLSVIPEESADTPSHYSKEAAGGDCSYLALSPTEREKQDCLTLQSVSEEGNIFEDAPSPVRASFNSSLCSTSPVDTKPMRTRRLSEGSASSRSQIVHQYTRDFLLKCWNSPLCRVMPAALQHTIPYSDIHYIIRIPTFEDPTFLLMDDTTPPNIKSANISSYCNRRRHPTWPSTMN